MKEIQMQKNSRQLLVARIGATARDISSTVRERLLSAMLMLAIIILMAWLVIGVVTGAVPVLLPLPPV